MSYGVGVRWCGCERVLVSEGVGVRMCECERVWVSLGAGVRKLTDLVGDLGCGGSLGRAGECQELEALVVHARRRHLQGAPPPIRVGPNRS